MAKIVIFKSLQAEGFFFFSEGSEKNDFLISILSPLRNQEIKDLCQRGPQILFQGDDFSQWKTKHECLSDDHRCRFSETLGNKKSAFCQSKLTTPQKKDGKPQNIFIKTSRRMV